MSELSDLYQEVVMDHYGRPRNFGKLKGASRTAEGFNPFCGDTVTVYLNVEEGVITGASFESTGCAISRASASMMTESIKGKSEAEARRVFEAVHQMLTRGPKQGLDADNLGDLEMLSGVARFPIRVKCASLSWHTLRAALEGRQSAVSTE